jgi:hypothetical protein
VYRLNTDKIRGLGWRSARDSRAAVTAAVDACWRMCGLAYPAGGINRIGKVIYAAGDSVKKVFLTGGAGFIGSHVTDMLMRMATN